MTSTPPSPVVAPTVSVLQPFVDAGLLDAPSVHVAHALARRFPDTHDHVVLAAALAVRGLSYGHVCIDLDGVDALITTSDEHETIDHLPWPDTAAWHQALARSSAVTVRDPAAGQAISADDGDLRPLVFDGTRLYLERYWRYERQVGDVVLARAATAHPPAPALVDTILDDRFGDASDRQREAARLALTSTLTVIAGGPGTGKTHTVARVLAAAHQLAQAEGESLYVALAAPTGKAAARMTEAVHAAVATAALPPALSEPLLATEATTLHRLLGWSDGVRFAHDASHPLPHDIVVVDETSMVALPLMARLLDAIAPPTRIVLVGDPFQLASVEAGAVLGDIVGPAARETAMPAGPLASNIVVLDRVHRFADNSDIAALADAVRLGDSARALALLRAGGDELTWVDPTDAAAVEAIRHEVVASSVHVARHALDGNADDALTSASSLKVLAGTRFGPLGSYAWRDLIEHRLARAVADLDIRGTWYVGRPVMITQNDHLNGLFNGDTGLVISQGGRPTVAFPGPEGLRLFSPSQLDLVDTWWSMTVHKSQGSEFDHAVVSLPAPTSRVLTRELLYTAITRARRRVTVVADEASIRAAIARPVARASGLGDRCWP
jgi:exodeoxyribonuclease V alpha subunit